MEMSMGRQAGLTMAVGLALLLAGYGVIFVPYLQLWCPTGAQGYDGVVKNVTGAAVGGVVVSLYTKPSYPADYGHAVTDEAGRWSVVLGGCPHVARFYWASDVTGPLIGTTENGYIPPTSNTRVDVSRQPLNLTWVSEYPNDRNVSITFSVEGDLLVEAEANVTGHPAIGFLSRTSSGAVGSSMVLQGNYTVERGSPFGIEWAVGTAYRIVDVNGSTLTYLALRPGRRFDVVDAAEYLTMEEAIQLDRARGIYPYLSVAAFHSTTYRTVFQWAPGDATRNLTLFGATIPLRYNLTEAFNETVSVGLVNPTAYDRCYVRFFDVLVSHWWFYGNGTCPIS